MYYVIQKSDYVKFVDDPDSNEYLLEERNELESHYDISVGRDNILFNNNMKGKGYGNY